VKVHVGASQLGVAKIGRHGEHVLVDLVIAIGTRFQGGDSPAVTKIVQSWTSLAGTRMQPEGSDCLQERRHHSGVTQWSMAQRYEEVIVGCAEVPAPLQIPLQSGVCIPETAQSVWP